MKTFFLNVLAALCLTSCAVTPAQQAAIRARDLERNPFEQFTRSYEAQWGKPRTEWNAQQQLQYRRDILAFYYRLKAEQSAQNQIAENQAAASAPAYNPYQYWHPVEFHPLNRPHSTWEPDRRGGYTIWNSDGTTQTATPNGRGGWEIH